MKMMHFNSIKYIILTIIVCNMLSLGFSSQTYTQETFTFSTQDELNAVISVNTQEVEFNFEIENTQPFSQDFNIVFNTHPKWDVESDTIKLTLSGKETKTISFKVSPPQELGYKRIVDSQGLSKFELDDEYFGEFDFPIRIDSTSSEDDLEVVFSLDVYSTANLPLDFELSPSNLYVSPKDDLSIRINALSSDERLPVIAQVSARLIDISNDNIYTHNLGSKEVEFSQLFTTRDVQFSIPASLSPDEYEMQIVIKVEFDEDKKKYWELEEKIEIIPFENLQTQFKKEYSFWSFRDIITIENLGNTKSTYTYIRKLSWYERLFLITDMNISIINSEHHFSSHIQAGETKEVEVSFRYGIIVLVIMLVTTVWGVKTYQEYKNPLDVELEFEQIKKVKHEGIKSFKVKLGFENLKNEEMEILRVVFKMPSYLYVKDASFSLTPPTKVLKGSSKYKLIWEFKQFEKGDARILGFELMNSKGVLGDIHFEDLEFEVVSKGKTSRYFTKVKTIQGQE